MIQEIRVEMSPWRESETTTQIKVRMRRYGHPDIGYDTIRHEEDFISFFDQMWNEIGRLIKEKAVKEAEKL